MELNTNQAVTNNPISQPTTPPVAPEANVQQKSDGKGIILLLIIFVLIIGMIGYIIFANTQMNNINKQSTENSTYVAPSPTAIPSPTPTEEEELEIEDPEKDLMQLDTDVQAL